MKIRDAYATINGDTTEHTMPSGGLDIIADDGKTLFGIRLEKDGTIQINAGHFCKHHGVILDDSIKVTPISSNRIIVERQEYK